MIIYQHTLTFGDINITPSTVFDRACERRVEKGAELAEYRLERCGVQVSEKGVERNVAEGEWSVKRAKCAAPATAPTDILLFSLYIAQFNVNLINPIYRLGIGTGGARSAAASQFFSRSLDQCFPVTLSM